MKKAPMGAFFSLLALKSHFRRHMRPSELVVSLVQCNIIIYLGKLLLSICWLVFGDSAKHGNGTSYLMTYFPVICSIQVHFIYVLPIKLCFSALSRLLWFLHLFRDTILPLIYTEPERKTLIFSMTMSCITFEDFSNSCKHTCICVLWLLRMLPRYEI